MKVLPQHNKCPICKVPLVNAMGPSNALLGIICETPSEAELEILEALSGKAGVVLKEELAKVGIHFNDCRVINIWQHEPNDKQGEAQWHLAQAIKWVKPCSLILLLGSDATLAFLDESVSNVSGLTLKSDLLEGKKVFAAPSPASLFYGMLGEMRLSFSRLGKEYAKTTKIKTKVRPKPKTKPTSSTKRPITQR